MAVYVDKLFPTTPSAKWPYRRACHMTADSLPELHVMADRIGLKRSWFQDKRVFPHYDLTGSKRDLALQHGAIETTISRRGAVDKCKT